jgi:anti-anti-sigma factor
MHEPSHEREPTRVDAMGIKPPPAYSIEDASRPGGPAVVVAGGQLDLAAVQALRERMDAADGAGLVIDVEGVTFVDSSALRELLQARARLAERATGLVLAAVPHPFRRLLELTGTLDLFETAPDRDAAVARLAVPASPTDASA